MAKIVGEKGGVNAAEGALLHTYVEFENGDVVTVGTSYHEKVAEGNQTVVFGGRDPFVLVIAGPLYETASAHTEIVLLALASETYAEFVAKLGERPTVEPHLYVEEPVAGAAEAGEGGFESLLAELAEMLGIDPSEFEADPSERTEDGLIEDGEPFITVREL